MRKYKKNGFTLIELMVVVICIGILSGVLLSVIDQNRQRARAGDASNLANLTKVVSAIESYSYSEGMYPKQSDNANGNPLENTTNRVLYQYLSIWPGDFVYRYHDSSGEFYVLVRKNVDGNYYKYSSSFKEVLECDSDTPNLLENPAACDSVSP